MGEARDGEEALVLAKRLQPDVVLMDIRMPHTSTAWRQPDAFASPTGRGSWS